MNASALLLVGLGGALGAVARHVVSLAITTRLQASFPWATLVVNLSGCVAVGFIVTFLALRSEPLPDGVRLFLPVGFVGAYTTFSTFELETLRLFEQGAPLRALAYVAASTIAGLVAVVAGAALARRLG